MKKFTSFLLVLALTFSMILGMVPFSAFADEAVEITDNSGWGGCLRKKSDGSILFSPTMNPLFNVVGQNNTNLEPYTIDMTFTLLSGNGGEEVHTFETVSAAIYAGQNQYYDIYLKGKKGDCGFCPTANSYYNVYIEIYQDRT